MNFDRNTLIGFILLAVLFFGFFWYNNKQYSADKKAQAYKDSIANIGKPKPDTIIKGSPNPVPSTTSIAPQDSNSAFFGFQHGSNDSNIVQNDVIRVIFSAKGGQPKYVELKNFKAPDSSNVKLAASQFNKVDYRISTSNNNTALISNYYFKKEEPVTNSDGSQTIRFSLNDKGRSIVHEYVIRPGEYMMDFNLIINGVPQLMNKNFILTWQNEAVQLQRDISYEREMTEICFSEDKDFDYYKISSRTEKEFDDPVQWVGVKQQFFTSSLVSREGSFSSGRMQWNNAPGVNSLVKATANLSLPVPTTDNANYKLGLYYGPTDYKTLKRYDNDMKSMVNLGTGMFAFVKYINRWIVIPIFDFFASLTSNFGIVILLLTLFIRLLTSPLMYPGYLTSAKMKILRPEIEQLKAKHPDQQQFAMEQMKFLREAGVNQFAGCLPGLLQIPIFFALYSFFNSSVALRGQSFLWSKDLSQYDSILNLPFTIPLYGNHVSLFTITAVLTSFLISLYSMNMSPDQSNPVLKYMPYFFPIVLLFIFNRLPSGLTWYYTVSNLITLSLQFVIQNYIINHDRLLTQIETNRKKPKKQSKWQERLAQMQDQQKQLKEAQSKSTGKR